MNIIKRIGVAFDLVVFGNLTPDQATEIFPLVKKSLCITEHLQELQRRSEKLAYIEGVGYTLNQPTSGQVLRSSGDGSVSWVDPKNINQPPKEPSPINRNNRRGSVQDAVLRCIDRLQMRYYTSLDVWREYQLSNGPKTTRGTVLSCVTYLRENGIIKHAGRKIGTVIVHEK